MGKGRLSRPPRHPEDGRPLEPIRPAKRTILTQNRSPTQPAMDERSAFEFPPVATGILKVALWSASAVVLVSFVVLAMAHAQDRFQIGWVQGTRMALARYANEGILFPPLYDGVNFGGTRFMPLPVLLHAGIARLTGEYLLSGKIASYLMSAIMFGLVFFLLKKLGCRNEIAVGLTATTAATWAGFQAVLSIQGDTLPVVWQLGAIALVAHKPDRRSVAVSGAFCVLAILSKLSAVWAPLAIGVWLFMRRRDDLAWFIGSFLLLLTGALVLLQAASDGRMFASLYELSFAGISGPGRIVGAPLRAIGMASEAGPAYLVLMPFAVVGAVLAIRGGWGLYPLALGFSVLTLLVILLDEGALLNHFIDVAVLSVMAVGSLVAARDGSKTTRSMIAALVGTAVVCGLLAFAGVTLKPQVIGAIETLRNGPGPLNDPSPTAGWIRPGDRILAEDPYVVFASDRFPPVILDAWALLRLEHRHPEWIRDLAVRIEQREFDLIVLSYSLDFQDWYSKVHLGQTIASAIGENYRLAEEAGGYFIYAPADD